MRELSRLKRNVSGKTNVKLIEVHSFEFSLLSFEYLENWVFSEEDELRVKRSNHIAAKNSFIKLVNSSGDAEDLRKFKSAYDFSVHNNTEKIAAKLLNAITRNTGFETDKSKIGDCFVNSCCMWGDRQADDSCGLDKNKLTAAEKMKLIHDHSVLYAAFKEANL